LPALASSSNNLPWWNWTYQIAASRTASDNDSVRIDLQLVGVLSTLQICRHSAHDTSVQRAIHGRWQVVDKDETGTYPNKNIPRIIHRVGEFEFWCPSSQMRQLTSHIAHLTVLSIECSSTAQTKLPPADGNPKTYIL
jgi:hypothetical protein